MRDLTAEQSEIIRIALAEYLCKLKALKWYHIDDGADHKRTEKLCEELITRFQPPF